VEEKFRRSLAWAKSYSHADWSGSGVSASRRNEQDARPQSGRASRQEWRTPPLWGIRDSGPYLHDGRATTFEQAIAIHGGEGQASAICLEMSKARANISAVRPLDLCGLALVRQLDHPDKTIRLNAAKLRHRIGPSILAGINIPEETP
jgi:hypothetical protein